MYAVCSGSKIFTLLPPSDYVFLNEQLFRAGKYKRKPDQSFEIEISDRSQPWIVVDPSNPAIEINKFQPFEYANPIDIEVKAGEILYLPAMWYHHVKQTGNPPTIAINYWHDMKFHGPLWIFMSTLRSLMTEN